MDMYSPHAIIYNILYKGLEIFGHNLHLHICIFLLAFINFIKEYVKFIYNYLHKLYWIIVYIITPCFVVVAMASNSSTSLPMYIDPVFILFTPITNSLPYKKIKEYYKFDF